MKKNVEYEISFYEILKMIRCKWKLVGIVMLACIILCGGYKAATDKSGDEIQSNSDYEKDAAHYDYYIETEPEATSVLKTELERVYYDKTNNPVFTVNPYGCEYEQIVIRFSDEGGNHDWIVNNWISNADNRELFGKQEDAFSNYKNSLIMVGQRNNPVETVESAVQIIAVENFDTKRAADYLVDYFKQCSTKDNVAIEKISSSSIKGYNKEVDFYQQNNRDKYNSIYSALQNTSKIGNFISKPTNPLDEQHSKGKSIVKFCILGLLLGLIIGIALVILDVIRKRDVISSRQVEEAFSLELLSDCSSGEEVALDVLNANLDVMTGEHSNIAIVVDSLNKDRNEIASDWMEKSDRSFIVCPNIFDNPDMIEALKTVEGIVIGVRLGDTKLEQIQRIVLRAEKLNLDVLGFVLL